MARGKASLGDDEALRLVVEGTAAETGEGFFRALVKNLARVMQTDGAWVTEYLPESRRLRAHAFWLGDDWLSGYEHELPGTPCEVVLTERRLVHYPDRILEIFRDDPDLVEMKAVSYMGVPLFDADGGIMGHLAVLDSKPLPASPKLLRLFEIFAARAAAEHRRLRVEQEVRAREEQVTALLESAMDGIVVLDEELSIVRVNPAAERLFGYPGEQILGQGVKWFVDEESMEVLTGCLAELEARPASARAQWLPSQLSVLRAGGGRVPAEATLSCFESCGHCFHTLILRNIDERLEAEREIGLLRAEADYLRGELDGLPGIADIIGSSAAMQELKAAIRQVAATEATVLVHGETGTGKELVASAVHDLSRRRGRALVRVNCAAIPGNLMESEFFGHERGAFTGATQRREGRFALADGGTLFLDEVGELPMDLQAKLLRVLQEGEFEPLGSNQTRKVDVRVVAATNRDLGRMVEEGNFREDLYYRLNVFPILVPPLRDRGDDIGLLAAAFQERFARRMGERACALHVEDIRRLGSYPWPGNIRELQNVIERALILGKGGRADLARALPAAAASEAAVQPEGEEPPVYTAREMEGFERANLRRALAAAGGKISGADGAAALIGVPPSTFSSRIKALGIERQRG
jgi:formate hydrogenlyase transcriptional activator